MAISYHCLFQCNNTKKENNDTLPLSSSFQTQKKQNTQENNKKNQMKGKSLPLSSHSAFSLLTFASAFLFQMLSLGIFFFSSKKKKKQP